MIPKAYQSLVAFEKIPPYLHPNLVGAWDQFKRPPIKSDRDKLIDLINFFAVLKSQGLTAKHLFQDGSNAFNPSAVYTDLLATEFESNVSSLVSLLRKMRLLNVFRVHKAKVTINTRQPYYASLALVLVPLRKEHLDGALAKCEGGLYYGDVPIQLRQRWKPLPAKSRAKPKSLLPRHTELLASESDVQSLPLALTDKYALHMRRAADDCLVLHFRIRNPGDRVEWCSRHVWEKTLASIFSKSVQSLGK